MTVRTVGWGAKLVELASAGEVRAAYRRLVGLPGLTEVVPAARTVLIEGDPLPATDELAALLADLDEEPPADGPAVELPVSYDGPDLDEVAELTGLAAAEVARRHAGADYVVAFCGFAPGFGYLTGLDERLHVPRRDTPRTKVPAGAVALASEFTAVYPRASPGGWQLIGRTDAALWEPSRDPPALLRPGTRVRFT